MRDEELLNAAHKGDAAAFHELMERHAPALFRLAFRFVGNESDAEDVVQESFMGAFQQIGSFRGEATVKTWLSRIVVRQSARLHRAKERTQRRTPQVIENCGEGNAPADIETSAESVERGMDVRRAVARLSPEHRQVILLREYEGMSYSEIAEVLGVPQGTVESRLYRARQELREMLRDYLQGDFAEENGR